MSQRTINKIKQMGFEDYVDNIFSKKSKRTNAVLIWFFILGGIMFTGAGLLTLIAPETTWGPLVAIAIGLASFFLAWKWRSKPTDNAIYKEELKKRHGDYKAILKEIDEKFATEAAHWLDAGFIAIDDWLIVLCTMQGAHFVHKSEIAAILGTSSGTLIIWDDGQSFTAYFNNGNYKWDEAFLIAALGNPYLLSNDDLVVNAKGETVTADAILKGKEADKLKLIVAQFLKNKEAGIVAYWAEDFIDPAEDAEEGEA